MVEWKFTYFHFVELSINLKAHFFKINFLKSSNIHDFGP